ncbi:MAG: hypothetical protein E7319_05790 [Clostridiales bacterium]|nr:hypothetical protein [Clostridiales bacterium]
MGFEVDTAEVRRVADEIKAIAGEVKQLSSTNVNRMKDSVEENLRGETADAIREALNNLSADIKSIGGGLDGIQKALYEYIRRVEAADRAAEEAIRG